MYNKIKYFPYYLFEFKTVKPWILDLKLTNETQEEKTIFPLLTMKIYAVKILLN